MYSLTTLTCALQGVDEPREEAFRLLEHFCGASRAALLCDRDRTYRNAELDAAVERRLAGEPLQYILGEWDFFGCRFTVTRDCLIPRPDTEVLVETALEYVRPGAIIADLCTGSGCIATALLTSRADVSLCAGLELYPATLELATQNAARNGVGDRFLPVQADLLRGGADVLIEALRARTGDPEVRLDMILSNPPYIRTNELAGLAPELAYEPRAALDGGADGLIFYRAILNDYASLLRAGGRLLLEIGADQAADVCALAETTGGWSDPSVRRDLGGRDRVICLRRA